MSGRAAWLGIGLCAALSGGCTGDHGGSAPLSSASSVPGGSASAGASATAAPVLTDAAGRALVASNCLSCHSEEMVSQQRLTAKQWGNVVKKMHGWGSPVEPENVEPLVAYLAATYGLSAGPHQVATISAKQAVAALEPQADGPFSGGDATRGAAKYHELCATCHGEDGRGAALGVCLADRPLLHRAADFAREVRKGRGRMPAYGEQAVPDAQIADMLAHLRTLR